MMVTTQQQEGLIIYNYKQYYTKMACYRGQTVWYIAPWCTSFRQNWLWNHHFPRAL